MVTYGPNLMHKTDPRNRGSESGLVRIEINYDVNQLSPNKRDHWAKKARNVESCKFLATQAWRVAGSPRWDVPVVCQITIYRGRTIDPDNALASCKAAIDGVFGGNATADDAAQYVEFPPVRIVSAKQYKDRPLVSFEISEKGAEFTVGKAETKEHR